MAFLTSDDYKKQIQAGQLAQIVQADTSIVPDAELFAQEKIEEHLRPTPYDLTAIFEAEGEDRNRSIITYMVDIALYEIHSRIAPNNIPTVRITRYESAIKWLESVRDGKISPGLPLKAVDPEVTTPQQESTFIIVSQTRQNWYF